MSLDGLEGWWGYYCVVVELIFVDGMIVVCYVFVICLFFLFSDVELV